MSTSTLSWRKYMYGESVSNVHNANKHILLALGSDHTGRDDVEVSRGGDQSACSRRFIHVKPRETNIQRML